MRRIPSIRDTLTSPGITVGTWIQIGHPAVGEILGATGCDWVAVDCEHTDIGLESFTALARAIAGQGPAVFARVRENDALAIRQALDCGADGVIVPLVSSAAEAAQAVAAAKYPPVGVRGFGYTRANAYGATFDEYSAHANQDTAVVVMIETTQAVAEAEAIAAVDGVDGLFIGPYDLSGSFGMPGKVDHPDVTEACRSVVAACRRAGKAPGIHLVTPTEDSVERAVVEGYTMVALGVDVWFLRTSSRQYVSELGAALRRGASS